MNPENKTSDSGNSAPSSGPILDTASQNIVMGILAYLGILVLIPLFVSKNDPFVKFHVKQGLVLFCVEIIIWIIASIIPILWLIFFIVDILTLVFSIVGIVNVVQHKEKVLPLFGRYSSVFKF